jgi:hypothetical protein
MVVFETNYQLKYSILFLNLFNYRLDHEVLLFRYIIYRQIVEILLILLLFINKR